MVIKLNQRFLRLLVAVELIILLIAVSLPLASIDEFWFFSSEFSILSLTMTLFLAEEYILSFIIVLSGFTIPTFKIFQKIFPNRLSKQLHLHKFSMLDIFLLSFLIFGGKLSYFYEINLKIGFYFLITSICLSYIPTARFDKLTPRQN